MRRGRKRGRRGERENAPFLKVAAAAAAAAVLQHGARPNLRDLPLSSDNEYTCNARVIFGCWML